MFELKTSSKSSLSTFDMSNIFLFLWHLIYPEKRFAQFSNPIPTNLPIFSQQLFEVVSNYFYSLNTSNVYENKNLLLLKCSAFRIFTSIRNWQWEKIRNKFQGKANILAHSNRSILLVPHREAFKWLNFVTKDRILRVKVIHYARKHLMDTLTAIERKSIE